MSNKKKVVTTRSKSSEKTTPTVSRRKKTTTATTSKSNQPLIFDKTNYMLMLAGIALVALGLLLMRGGAMPSPDVWDENIIYSTRRTVLAPLVILIGLGVEIYAIFKRSDNKSDAAQLEAS